MANEVEILLKEIQFKTGLSLEEIADKIEYSRPYLNNVKLKGGGEKIVGILKEKFAETLQKVSRATSDSDQGDSKYVKLLEDNDRFFKDLVKFNLSDVQKNQKEFDAMLSAGLELLIEIQMEERSEKTAKDLIKVWRSRVFQSMQQKRLKGTPSGAGK